MTTYLMAASAECPLSTTWADVAFLGVGAVIIAVLTAGAVAWLWIINR